MPHDLLRIDHFPIHHGADLPVRPAGIKADAAAVHVAANGTGAFVCLRTLFQRQINDLQRALVELLEKVAVKGPDALRGIVLLQPPGDLRAAADIHPEAADGPQQEFYIPLHIPVIRLCHSICAVDHCPADGKIALFPFYGNGDGLPRTLAVGIRPNPKGNKTGVQLRYVFHSIWDA